jgi:hypothetical protein
MRPVIHKNHKIMVYPKWDARAELWSCDAIVCVLEPVSRNTIHILFDTLRSYRIKATAVTAILNVTRRWIDEGKPEDRPEQ